jgi:hypothetical protein
MNLKNAARILTLACVAQVLGYAYALPGHLSDPTWSDHAQFHHVLGWIWLVGLNIAIVVFAWGPLQKRDRSSFWVLVILFLLAQGGHFIASVVVPAGRPSEFWYDYALGATLLIFAIGLGTGWRALSQTGPK